MTPATYSTRERLRDGRPIQIRALRPDDEAEMLAAVDRTNPESLRRRFFVTRRGFSEKEKTGARHWCIAGAASHRSCTSRGPETTDCRCPPGERCDAQSARKVRLPKRAKSGPTSDPSNATAGLMGPPVNATPAANDGTGCDAPPASRRSCREGRWRKAFGP
jgi:hypothetical protein